MGDIADMMLDGTLCECCGVIISGEAPGYPRYCSKRCKADRTEVVPKAEPGRPLLPKTNCPKCGKRIKRSGLDDHMKAVHKEQ